MKIEILTNALNIREPGPSLTSLPIVDMANLGDVLTVRPLTIYEVEDEDGNVMGWCSANSKYSRVYAGEVEEEAVVPIAGEPLWLQIARKEIGVKEVRGGENPRIIEYHATTTLKAKEDEIPWCSSFINWCMKKAGYKGTQSAAAISWASWGKVLKEPKIGCVVVFSRTGGNHVGFYLGKSGSSIKLLGGNQSNEVNISYQDASRLLGYRWPNA